MLITIKTNHNLVGTTSEEKIEVRKIKPDQVYFPNLNGIRAIAAFMVIVFHIELIKREFNYTNIENLMMLGGELGVVLFFVLSGFLITYLLLSEQSQTRTISLKNFYIRRMLRIWPLYFLVVISCLFILPHFSFLYEPLYSTTYLQSRLVIVFLYLFFMSNVLTGADSHANFARPTWSVSVEEQFYLIWPILIKFSKKKFKTIIGVIALYWTIRILILIVSSNVFYVLSPSFLNLTKVLNSTWYYTPFDSLSVGALSALALFNKSPLLNLIYKKKVQVLLFVVVPCLVYFLGLRANIFLLSLKTDFTNEIYSLFFALAILNLAGNPNVIVSLENKIFSYLGKISFGLYLYHWVIIVFIINMINKFMPNISNTLIFNLTLYAATFALTIGVASLSYFFFEYKFLKLKHKFSRIVSGDFVIKKDL